MWSRQIFVAILSIFVVWQQVAAVVNNNPSKIEESSQTTSDNPEIINDKNEDDTLADATEEKGNRREASIDAAPLQLPANSYLPAEHSNKNLPVPVYGVPDAPSNNIVYPEPPPDKPPPISLPSNSYGLPHVSNTYGPPIKNNFVPPSNLYGSPGNTYFPPSNIYGPPPSPTYGPPKFIGAPPSRKPVYGPPRFQYGPPGKPLQNNKFGFKPPFKSNFGLGGTKYSSKPISTYGPPISNFKDNYSPAKFTSAFSSNSYLSNGGSFGHFSSGATHNNFGTPSFDLEGNKGISSQYGPPNYGYSVHNGGNTMFFQYGAPNNELNGLLQPQYGPPQPLSHPRPPHPGVPAPPTPPDIKYDGWQPIPGLVSKVPTPEYGTPVGNHQHIADLSYNKDLSPPPLDGGHIDHQPNHHGSVANLELENSYEPPIQKTVSDSYGAPLNTVTGSGGIISASGEEAHGNRDNHHDHNHNLNVGLSAAGISGQNIHAIKSIGYEIFPNNAAKITGGQVSNSYGAPPANIYTSGLNSAVTSHSYSSFNSHKNHGHKGFSSYSELGLLPPSGMYGTSGGSYGTPLSSKAPFSYFPSKLSKGYGPPIISNLYGPSSHSATSFQDNKHGSSLSFINLPTSSGHTGYNAPVNIVDYSYNHPQGFQYNANVAALDYSHPGITIDLTQNHGEPNTFANSPHDCKSQSLPSLSYEVPYVNKYNAALSSLTTNIGNSGSAISESYGTPEPLPVPQQQIKVESKPHETYGVPDLAASHSERIHSELKINSIEADLPESEGKTYGQSVAANFGPSSELVQSESIDFSNIPLQGALESYSLQIQSADGGQTKVAHGQLLNDGLLQSILAAIEQPKGPGSGQPVIQFQKSLEQQNFVTNDTISSVVEQLTDAEIRHSTKLAKDDILKTSEAMELENNYFSQNNKTYASPTKDIQTQYSPSDQDIQYSSPTQYIITATDNVNENKNSENNEINSNDSEISLLQNNGIALYFSNNQRLKKKSDESSAGVQKIKENSEQTE